MIQIFSFNTNFKKFIEIGDLLAIAIAKLIDVQFLEAKFEGLQIYAFISMIISYIFLILPDNSYFYLKIYFFPANSNEKEKENNNSLTRRYRTTINTPNL